ncbi:MAG: TetR/AcrR family transcriptional regulator [Solirubrobacteraceae bacterium]
MSPARASRAQRAAVTRAALLRAASHAICERGMQGASIDLIAERAGYTKGAFYAHFPSKEALFLTMLEEKFAADLERLEAAMVGVGQPAEEARQAAGEFLHYVDRDPEWPRLYQEFAAHAARNDEFRVEFAQRQRALRDGMAELFARWSTSFGVEPTVSPADVAAMTFFMADGFLVDRIIDPELDDGLYGRMVEIFLRGLIAMAEARPADR